MFRFECDRLSVDNHVTSLDTLSCIKELFFEHFTIKG